MTELISPTPGVLWHTPSPDAEPFCRPGDRVVIGQQVAVIEVMKMFAPIEAEVAGVFGTYTVENGTAVNAGDAIALLEEGR